MYPYFLLNTDFQRNTRLDKIVPNATAFSEKYAH